ncbi:MAG: flavin reductase family protein [Methylococcaceae bacterium]|nr:flavin reductase family protein [Methylococcaceae bacterium]MDZ4157575.1 flavin reductase family protein [Methylococcales bacterium]MDP2395066.1 flavin reductase family protein [Methylococcaceae bacterium]MDP3019317.1 flavin reductase family protein [Methylococcaceae bacterium]MDP3389103.1 flavin reductase family protein [Methylococcaceae bacterium]
MIKNIDDVFKSLTHGVYVIGVRDDERQNAFTAAWVMQVSHTPPLLAFSINPKHYSYQLLKAGKICTVNVLAETQIVLAEHFGQSGKDKMADFQWHQDKTGAPILLASLAYFDCQVSHFTEAGDHVIAICEVLGAARVNHGRPMLYSQTGDLDGSSELYLDSL